MAAPSTTHQFITSGSALLDCVLGGGWPLGRIANIVGDKSTGKSLLAIEACANFARQFPDGKIWYAETEAAFDTAYAESLGIPIDQVSFKRHLKTVENFYKHLSTKVQYCKDNKVPGLYVLDSLDALSDDAEADREIGTASFGASKAKQLSEFFRRIADDIEEADITLFIVSQIRDNIGVSFGRKYKRSGGKALDFYASQVLYLAHMGVDKRTIKKIERAVGVKIKAKCDKNKIGLPLRECEFSIQFGFGVDDLIACLNWLEVVARLDDAGLTKEGAAKLAKQALDMDSNAYGREAKRIGDVARKVWNEIETDFLPKRRKY